MLVASIFVGLSLSSSNNSMLGILCFRSFLLLMGGSLSSSNFCCGLLVNGLLNVNVLLFLSACGCWFELELLDTTLFLCELCLLTSLPITFNVEFFKNVSLSY